MTGFGAGVGFLVGAAFGPVPAIVTGLALIGWLLATGRVVSPMATAVIGIAVLLGFWRGEPLPDEADIVPPTDAATFFGVVLGAPSTRSTDQTFVILLESPFRSSLEPGEDIRLSVTAGLLPTVRPGDRVRVSGFARPTREFPAGFARYLRTLGAVGTLNAFSFQIEERATGWRPYPYLASAWYGRMVARAAPGDRGALIAGLVTGRDDALSDERKDAFRRTGTGHITAVSGSNLALLVTIAAVSGKVTGLRRRLAWQLGVVVFLWGYALLAGFEPPVNRAALVATGVVVAGLLGRRADALTLLAVGGAALVAIQPLVLWSISFQLSMAASAALALVFEPDEVDGWAGLVRAGITATVAAQIATLPFALGAFGALPLLSIPANLIVAPLAGAAFFLGAVAGMAGLVSGTLGAFIAALAGLPAGWVLRTVDLLGGTWSPVIEYRTTQVETSIIAALCALAICVWSHDGQTWLRRTLEDANRYRVTLGLTFGPAVAGFAIVLAITTR